jgi:hypothetical protein
MTTRDVVINALNLIKSVTALTPTMIDDFVVDTVLANPALIDTITNYINSIFHVAGTFSACHLEEKHFADFDKVGISKVQTELLVRKIQAIVGETKKT